MPLTEETRAALFEAARMAAMSAYAPYSEFHVGAALLSDEGHIYSGCNVENVSYPMGMCAEMNAVGDLVKSGARAIEAVLVLADSPMPIQPCGGCRQRLIEFGKPSVPVLLANSKGIVNETTLGALLPSSFSPAHLKRSGDV